MAGSSGKMLTFGADMRSVPSPLLHACVWLRRFRHRRGYGVHSPWAFSLICSVINERGHYYAYDELLVRATPRSRHTPSLKVQRLLLRLANYVQPQVAVVVGRHAGQSADYLQAGCRHASVVNLDSPADTLPQRVDLLYVAPGEDFVAAFARCAPLAAEGALFVLSGIHASRRAAQSWRTLRADKRTGATFDLYDVGLIFFDHVHAKQHYMVNF